ncbi:MAG: hypothetical protein HUJ97_10120, partial [Bacteroidales bacterium]|nr:hypothetical protein [Bacteroidales bacterium]
MIFDKRCFVALFFLLTSCAIRSDLSHDVAKKIVGIYKHKVPFVPETIIELNEDFTYRMYSIGIENDFGVKTRPDEGKWKYSKGMIVLDSFLDVDINDYNCFIDKVNSFGFHGDSIVVQLLSLYDDNPMENFGVSFRFHDGSRQDTLLFVDKNGMVSFPRDGVKSIIGIYGLKEIAVPPIGYHYIVHVIDCEFLTHKHEKLQRNDDTLIMRSKVHVGYTKLGTKKYKTFERKFV